MVGVAGSLFTGFLKNAIMAEERSSLQAFMNA